MPSGRCGFGRTETVTTGTPRLRRAGRARDRRSEARRSPSTKNRPVISMALRWSLSVSQVTAPYVSGPRIEASFTAKPHNPKNSAWRSAGVSSRPSARPADWLAPKHTPAMLAATQKPDSTRREVRDQHHRAPPEQRQRQRPAVPEPILPLPEQERAQARRDVHEQNEHDRVLRREAHGDLSIDGGQRNHRLHARLVQHDAAQEAHEIFELPRVP